MRIPTLAGLILFASLGSLAPAIADESWSVVGTSGNGQSPLPRLTTGSGVVAGASENPAVYLSGAGNAGRLQREIPLDAWRGKRLRLSLRLKNDGNVHAWSRISFRYGDGKQLFTDTQRNIAGDAWEAHQFVLDVAGDATALVIFVGLEGTGKVWVEGLTLEPAGADVPLTPALVRTPRNSPPDIAGGWSLAPGVGKVRTDGTMTLTAPAAPVFVAGTATQPGTTGSRAAYLSGDARGANMLYMYAWGAGNLDRSPEGSFLAYGGLEQAVSLQPWRGKRLCLTVRMKNEGGARAYVSAWIGKSNNTAIRTVSRVNRPRDAAWQVQTLVLDVPDNADKLLVYAGFTGVGTIWVDGLALQAAEKDVPVSWSERIDSNIVPQNYPVPQVRPSPGPVRNDED